MHLFMPFFWTHAFLFYKGRGKEGGVRGGGGGINGHAHRYLLTLPATRVFPFFGVKASFGDDSSSWRFTFGRRKCLLESPKWQQMQNKKLDQIFLSQQIPCSNGAISFPHTTSPEEFVSRPLCVMCIILHEICTPTYANRRFLVLFILPGWKIVIAT